MILFISPVENVKNQINEQKSRTCAVMILWFWQFNKEQNCIINSQKHSEGGGWWLSLKGKMIAGLTHCTKMSVEALILSHRLTSQVPILQEIHKPLHKGSFHWAVVTWRWESWRLLSTKARHRSTGFWFTKILKKGQCPWEASPWLTASS